MSSTSDSRASDKKGLVELVNGHFRISGDPHVLYRASKAIINARTEKEFVMVPVTDETAYDVMWFSHRFPLRFQDNCTARTGAAAFIKARRESQVILDPNYKPKRVKFRKGLKPRPYQQIAADLWMVSKGLLVGDEMGLGKTVEAAAGLADPRTRPAVVIAQANLCRQWQDSLRKFLPDVRAHVIKQRNFYDMPEMQRCNRCGIWTERAKRGMTRCTCGGYCDGAWEKPDVLIISFSKLDAWVSHLMKVCKSMIVDECQELRNSDSNKWQAANTLARCVPYRLGLSGTPVVNYGGEIFNIYECLYPNKLGDKATFKRMWCSDCYHRTREPPLENPEAFGAYIREQGIFIRRTRADVGRELPPLQKIIHPIDSNVSAFDGIKGRAAELARIILDGSKVKGQAMAAASEFEMLLRMTTGLAKAPYVASFVDMLLEQGTRLVLFGYHRAVYDIWMEQLAKWKPLLYTGSESAAAKYKNQQRFQGGESNLLICSLRSTAGLDGLQHANCYTTVFGELDWSRAKHDQGIARVYRDGQKEPCIAYFLVSEEGSDPMIAEICSKKGEQSDKLLGVNGGDSDILVDSEKHIKDLAYKFLQSVH